MFLPTPRPLTPLSLATKNHASISVQLLLYKNMDPLSQACLGASLSQSSTNTKSQQMSALIIGGLSGMAADLDVLIQSPIDPLLFLEYHRQFTHSLIFIPFGALLCSLFFYAFFKNKLSFKQIYIFAFLGYATHGLLDACTSYGTLLFWPFSDARIAWNNVSIVDPFFTLPVSALVLLAAFKQRPRYAKYAFSYALIFLSLGFIQKHRAEIAAFDLAQTRGHNIERLHVKPSFANRHVWKIIYEYNNRYYVDAAKILWSTTIFEGDSIAKLNLKRDFSWLDYNSQTAKDIERFRWFSDDFLAASPNNPNTIIDVRYSLLPNQINPIWRIELNPNNQNSHVQYIIDNRLTSDIRQAFFEMLF